MMLYLIGFSKSFTKNSWHLHSNDATTLLRLIALGRVLSVLPSKGERADNTSAPADPEVIRTCVQRVYGEAAACQRE